MRVTTSRANRWITRTRGALLALTLAQIIVSPPNVFSAGPSALSFDGVRSEVTVPDSASLRIATNLTAEAWIKPSVVAARSQFAGKGTWELSLEPVGGGFRLLFEYSTGFGTWHAVASGQYPFAQWYHVAGTYDGATARLYVNGVLAGTATSSGNIDPTSNAFHLATVEEFNDYYKGLIDEVRISNVVRYTAGFTPPQAPFVADANTKGLWHLDEGTGTAAGDASGNGNNGTLSSGPVWSADTPFSGAPDTTPPTFSSVAAGSLTTTGATITWTTNEAASSQVEYGTTLPYGSATTLDPALVVSHTVALSGLTPDTTYNFRADSKDAAGNAGASANFTFKTLAGVGTPPVISNVTAGSLTQTSAVISWTTDVLSDSQVEYGATTSYGSLTTLNTTAVVSHGVTVSGLSAGQTYHYRVLSRGQNALLATSADATFATAPPNASTVGQWSAVMNWPLVAVHAALLPTGDVVVWDAWETPGTPSGRLWHPASQTFTSVPVPMSALFCAGQTYLADGRAMVIGGHHGGDIGIADTNAFDSVTSNWTPLAPMHYSRWYPTAVALSDGRLLALGGEVTPNVFADVPEVYDPVANTWTLLPGATLNLDEYPPAFVGPDGKVVVIGPDFLTRKLDVGTQNWQTFGASPVPTGTNAMYRPGLILGTGGGSPNVDPVQRGTAILDLNQPTPTWRSTNPMSIPRVQHNLVLLPDGKVLAVGGSNLISLTSTTGTLVPEMWDPSNETWSSMAPMHDLRMYHSFAMLLPDARILVAGGGRVSPANDYPTAEIYSPPYLFKGARPTIASAPGTATYGATLAVDSPDQASIASVAFIRLPSVTHTAEMSARFMNLSFSHRTGGLDVQSPANANVAPPGYYMMFLVNAAGVPSVATMVKLGGTPPADTQPPTTSITTPTGGATVSGTVSIVGSAADNVGVVSLQFLLDGSPLGAPLTNSPYTISWDTLSAANGPHSVSARALDAAGNAGVATAVSVTVANNLSSPTVTAGVAPTSIVQGSSATLSWNTTNATSVTIDHGIGAVGASGSRSVSPAATTTYTVTATNTVGSTSAAATLTVTAPPPVPTATLNVSPTIISAGASATLSWSTTDATTVTIDQGIGSVATPGSRSVSPSATTTYTLTASNISGSATATTTLTVNGAPPPPSSSSLKFNGSTSRARFTTLPAMTVFTAEVWVKRSADTGRYETFLSNAAVGYGKETFGVYVDGGNADCGSSPPDQFAWAYTKSNGGWFVQCSGVTADLNVWHHVAVTRDAANTARIFVDGVLRGTTTNTAAPTSSTGALGVGDAGDALDEYFNGLLDEVRISSVARYSASFTPPTVNFSTDANTLALYHFDETSGQTLVDSSGNGRNGVLGATSATEAADPPRSTDVPIH